jgi:formyl-CoA transferase
MVAGALDGVIVLDLSRILAGPTATQMLGDLGATVIKVENPKTGGEDTRSWGPNYAVDADGNPTDLSAYFMCANRNKRSISVDIATKEGQDIFHQLAARADIIVENFKPKGLEKYGLDHKTLCQKYPSLVYCSISGFGQTGPNAAQPGYDLLAQGYGGLMSLTGDPQGSPMKVGVGISDVMCGMYATIAILAALRHRDATGEGQHIDIGLVDTQMAWLINEGMNYLTTDVLPERRGNGHPNIVPYDVFETSDGHVIIAVGNDAQFSRFCDFLARPDLAQNPKFKTNTQRIKNRLELMHDLRCAIGQKPKEEVIAELQLRKIPVGPIHNVKEALRSDQAKARDAVISMPHDAVRGNTIELLGNPLKFSATPVTYRYAPPLFGQDTQEILAEFLPLDKKP